MSNYLGIVTRVDLATFSPGDDVWGGQVVTPIDTTGEQITALVSFNDPEAYDEHVALTVTFVYVWDLGMSVVVNKEYTRSVANSPVFDVLALLPVLSSIQRITNIKVLLMETDAGNQSGIRYISAFVSLDMMPPPVC